VGEGAIHFAIQLRYLAAKAPIELRSEHAGDAVAAIHGDAHRPRELHVAHDAVDVRVEDVRLAALALPAFQVVLLDPAAQALDVVAVTRLARHDHLEAVVFGRVVLAAHGQADAAVQVVGREIGEPTRSHGDVYTR